MAAATEQDVRPIQELIPWLFPVTDQLVVCKDSGLLASFEFVGVDGDATTTDDINALLDKIDNGFDYLSKKHISIWWTVLRKKSGVYPEGEFADPVAQMLDNEHRAAFLNGQNFINRHFVTISLYPEVGTSRYLDRVSLLIKDGFNPPRAAVQAALSMLSTTGSFQWSSDELVAVVKNYEELLSSFSLAVNGLGLRRLVGEEFHGFLHKTVSPGSDWSNVKLPENGIYMDAALPDKTVNVWDGVLSFGETENLYGAGLSMKGWPESTYAGCLDGLLSIPSEFILSHIYRVAGDAEVRKHATAVKRHNDLLKYPLKSWIMGAFSGGMSDKSENQVRRQASEDAQHTLDDLSRHDIHYGWHNVSLIMFGKTPEAVKESADYAIRMLQDAGMPGVIRENIHLLSAWASTMPGQWAECQRWLMLSTNNLGEIAPIQAVLPGEQTNDYLTQQTRRPCAALTVLTTNYATPFFFNFHSGALGHALVIGPTRSGKSVFMNFLLSQWQKYQPCRAIIFDKDASCKISTLLQGGQHINLSSEEEEIKLNPMAMVTDRTTWGFLASWIEGLICSRGYVVNAEDAREIMQAIEEVSQDPNPEHRRLMTIHTLLPQRLAIQLESWVGDAPNGRYFDNVEDSFSLSNFCCIEMGSILRDRRLARAFMDYAFFRIQRLLEQNRTQDVVPTFIYLEECWFLLEDEVFAQRIKDWLKTLAKLTAHVVMATQSLEDIVESGSTVFSSIRDNIQTRIFLPNRAAGTETLKRIYRTQFELTDDQIELVRKARPQRDYFIVKPNLARMVSCSFNKRQLSVLRSDALVQGIFDQHYKGGAGKPGWEARYIEDVVSS